MKLAEVAFVLTCPKCGAEWLPHDEERWRAYLGCDEDLEEPAELFFYCPACAAREFGGDS